MDGRDLQAKEQSYLRLSAGYIKKSSKKKTRLKRQQKVISFGDSEPTRKQQINVDDEEIIPAQLNRGPRRSISLDVKTFKSAMSRRSNSSTMERNRSISRSKTADLRSVPLLKIDSQIQNQRANMNASRKNSSKKQSRASDIVQGALARLLFLCHSVIGVLLVIGMGDLKSPYRYFILAVLGPQVLEAFITLVYRRGREWKWVTPCIMFHITATAPAVWVLQLTEVERNLVHQATNPSADTPVCTPIDPVTHSRDEPFKDLADWAEYMTDDFCACGNCIQIMVQLLLLLLVIGRWLCPRSGTVSMAQKAVMLFHNFAVTSDILDLFRLLKEEKVNTNPMLVTVTLCLWTSGIIQIGIVVTERKEGSKVCGSCLDNGVWSILAVLVLDDIPFLVFRFVLIIYYKVFSYTIFFFTCKNLLLTALNTNKLIAIAHEHNVKVTNQKKADLFRPVVDEMNKSSAMVKIQIPHSQPPEDMDGHFVPNDLVSAVH